MSLKSGVETSTRLIISTHDLCESYDAHMVVDHVNLQVGAYQIFGLIGPNGAGKSTLIKMLTVDSSGRRNTKKLEVAMMVHGRTAHRCTREMLRSPGRPPAWRRENYLLFWQAIALEMTGLTEAANRPVQNYSGGMLRRLEIAQSTLHRPMLLIMDEPTVGLDPIARGAGTTRSARQKHRADFRKVLNPHPRRF